MTAARRPAWAAQAAIGSWSRSVAGRRGHSLAASCTPHGFQYGHHEVDEVAAAIHVAADDGTATGRVEHEALKTCCAAEVAKELQLTDLEARDAEAVAGGGFIGVGRIDEVEHEVEGSVPSAAPLVQTSLVFSPLVS